MPQILNRDTQTSQKKTGQHDTAVVKQKSGPNDEPRQNLPWIIGAAGVFTLLFIVFLFHNYVHPLTQQVNLPHKVAPLPGFADENPYNTKEWQDAYKQGRTGPVSGVPRYAIPGASGAGNPQAGGTGTP